MISMRNNEKRFIKQKDMNNRGETMIEILFSLIVISIIVTMASMVIRSSNTIISTSVDSRSMLEEEVKDLSLDYNTEVIDTTTVHYTYTTSGGTYSGSFDVDRVHVKDKSLQKFK